MECHKVTTKQEAQAYMSGYQQAVNMCCEILKRVTMCRKSIFGISEERAFDDDFIVLFREEAYNLFELKVEENTKKMEE